ncbi:MAG: radical SAM protein [bacterium]|nr:radical SAM protein [bacterium]
MSYLLKQKAWKLLSEEKSCLGKRYTHEEVKIVLVFPNTYSLGMSNLGFQTIFNLLNQRDDIHCERAFLPEKTEITEYIRTNTSLFSLESQTPLKDFDIIAFSISFELDYLNVLRILTLAKLPILSEERDISPLIISGGATCFLNPEPLVDFIDLFILGEGEEVLPDFIEEYKKEKNSSKNSILDNLSKVKGIYVPSLFNIQYTQEGKILKIEGKKNLLKRVSLKDINNSCSYSSIITNNTELKNQFLLEITRGCTKGCRFCLTGSTYRPFRFKEKEVILFQAKSALKYTNKIGLVGPNICDHPEIENICQELACMGFKISTSSLQSISLSKELIHSFSQNTITIAPECGNDKLRFSLNKNITNEDIIDCIRELKSISKLKLYFLIGLPQESMEDIEALISFVNKIKKLQPSRKIILSINPFIPKPHTALQWQDMEDENILNKKISLIKNRLKKSIKISIESLRLSILQGILSRGDRRLGKLLVALQKTSNIKQAFKEIDLLYNFYRFRNFGDKEILPWDHLDCGPNKEFLLKEEERYFKKEISKGCPGECNFCGICSPTSTKSSFRLFKISQLASINHTVLG